MKLIHALAISASAAAMSLETAAAAPAPREVIETYTEIAHAQYSDALAGALTLQSAIDAFLAAPSAETQEAAKDAWRAARVPYQQTEGYRFGNAAVDDWEGRVNAWPLDEGLIDYVAPAYGSESDANPLYTANIIANPVISFQGETIDATTITPEVLRSLNEAGDVEANVAIGYHAIEFLLWGQDLNGTGPGAGDRPFTDYLADGCTGGHCDRRAAYLKAASDLLVSDLQEIVAAWEPGGAAQADLAGASDPAALASAFKGLGSLSYGELAGERMKLGLILHDPEEEHDCFSDNTHNSHYYNQVGMMAIYEGRYPRTDGTVVEGPGLSALVAASDPAADAAVKAAMAETLARMTVMKETADSGAMAYDQMLGAGNEAGNKILQDVIDALVAQTRAIEGAVGALDLGAVAFEGSDSLDDPAAVTAE
ncbi:MAG: peptidase [Alphaproteobacteria bacterium]|nr:peptidase [Alphaproteobacteria bacterium]